jgi:thiamine-phosphate pyrophosphorylase
VIHYLITDGSAAQNPAAWLENVEHWIRNAIDFLQIREPDLITRELAALVKRVCSIKGVTKVLINDRADVAIAAGADGVHLRDGSIEAKRIRSISTRPLIVSVACHSVEGVAFAARAGADLAILAPIFLPLSKPATRPALGLNAVTEAAGSANIPVIALGGVTQGNAGDCIKAGAAGVGGISLFSTRAKQNR